MTRNEFLGCLRAGDFTRLFIECGWDNPTTRHPVPLEANGQPYVLSEVAQKRGFRVYVCVGETIPDSAVRRVLDAKLGKLSHDNFVIYRATGTGEDFHHLWSIPVRSVDRRHLVTVEYQTEDQAAFLLEKVNDISFGFDADEGVSIVDVVNRVNAAFLVNADKVTKDFYRGFRVQHKAFVAGIENLPEEGDREWYASVMLNRLMFCYFIQKKGFLDSDTDYLGKRLAEVQAQRGKTSFYASFYKGFLKQLFGEGLNAPANTRSAAFRKKYGIIPYLNGGMFAKHEIEEKNPDLDIPDAVFENLFRFFDQWRWHLDSRLTATGRDINPDVLGYIFEQYINDRAQMGAYYTKEDITEYIGRNCIVPYLFEAVKKADAKPFAADGPVWRILKDNPDRYIFAAVRKGAELPLPPEIEKGVDTAKPDLRKRREEWNRPTPEKYALPTEIWRETVARRQRHAEIRAKIEEGEIADIHDFITYNLDIRLFAEDVIRKSNDSRFILHFYNALREVTVLDPTCGSGAFLFAALNILEPLYEACLDRMEEMNAANPNLFKAELEEIAGKFRSNRKYFVYKNIILRNLYGVDIMHEATEIARLRLFLKMVAVVDVDRHDPNLGLDPLPDIDFNIRCGNTLVGYATEKEIQDGLVNGDMFAYVELKKRIEDEMTKASAAFDYFRREQLNLLGSHADLIKAKREINQRLAAIRVLLDRQLYATNGGGKSYDQWHKDTQPFHWYTEFYPVMAQRGGFDVIIGNPPYVVYTKKDRKSGKSLSDIYRIDGYATLCSNNLYAFTLERCLRLSCFGRHIGMIVPLSFAAAKNMFGLRNQYSASSELYVSTFEIRPAKLFDGDSGADQRLNIVLRHESGHPAVYTTGVLRWHNEQRQLLFPSIYYTKSITSERIARFSSCVEFQIQRKFCREEPISLCYSSVAGQGAIHYRSAGLRYWIIFVTQGFGTESASNKCKFVSDSSMAKQLVAALNSDLYWWYYSTNFDMFNQTDANVGGFRYTFKKSRELELLADELEADMNRNKVSSVVEKSNGGVSRSFAYDKKKSKPIIDKIDELLAKHYGFTEEELDFIINYDIKYRMGDELNGS